MKRSDVRMPVRVGQFYEASPTVLKQAALEYAAGYKPPKELGTLVGGVVPHAGWMYSGRTAAKVFATLAAAKPEAYVLLGAVHQWHGRKGGIFPSGSWLTPLGELPVDADLASAILEAAHGSILSSAAAHDMEHSIEVQLPFIQALSPGAQIVPIAVPPVPEAAGMGEAVAAAVGKVSKRVMVVASTDLTHYGMDYGTPDHGPLSKAMGWMHANDRRVISLAESLKAEEIVAEAREHFNACGPGALAAATAAARAMGATAGRVLEYTTSAEVLNELDADRAVGYVGMVFEK
ncbi:MAG: AmmeMemoRadiSam system protein B [Candidatus Brocadiia bacterium]